MPIMMIDDGAHSARPYIVKPYRPVKGRQDPMRRLRGARNFWVGVVQAITMRAALRKVHGHVPYGGTTPSGGEHWTAIEVYRTAPVYDTAMAMGTLFPENLSKWFADPRKPKALVVRDSKSPARLQPTELLTGDVSVYRVEWRPEGPGLSNGSIL